MKPNQSSIPIGKFLTAALITCLPVFWAAMIYVRTTTRKETEELAVAVTLGFYIFIYIGMYLSRLATGLNGKGFRTALLLLISFTILMIAWLFFYTGNYFIDFITPHPLYLLFPFTLALTSIGMVIKLTIDEINRRINLARANEAQSKMELQLLQSQLSPHFLFNTLNNVYGISISQPEKVPTLLLKLSDMLRYSLYHTKTLHVPLKDELAYIHNYIDFEKIRIGERLRLNIDIDPAADHYLIAPLLLIIFLENAFKHSKNSTEKQISVNFSLKISDKYIFADISNSHTGEKGIPKAPGEGGLGLENVKKRLALLYPNEHELKVRNDNNIYHISLKLKIKTQ